MNKQSIENLRRRIILTTTLQAALVMLLMAGLIYAVNLMATSRIRRIQINRIIASGGVLASDIESLAESELAEDYDTDDDLDDTETEQPEHSSEESDDASYSSNIRDLLYPKASSVQQQDDDSQDAVHYFTVYYDTNGEYVGSFIHDSYIGSEENAVNYANEVQTHLLKYGTYQRYYYKVASTDEGIMVVFLDSTELLNTNNRLFYIALILLGFGTIVTLLLAILLSYRMIRPEIENAERQKKFITNASHELKTPLAVIRANTEVEQMINGENEWNTSTMRQVDRLTALVENLVEISRAAERDLDKELFTEIDLSPCVKETADTFRTVAQQDGKTLQADIPEHITLVSSEGDIRQLASLLLDNAIKYCDEGGTVSVSLSKRSKTVHLTVSNTFAAGAGVDYSRFFDRFYRQDESHALSDGKSKSGFGIGLSIAEGLVDKHHGKIQVTWKDGIISFHCQLKPVL